MLGRGKAPRSGRQCVRFSSRDSHIWGNTPRAPEHLGDVVRFGTSPPIAVYFWHTQSHVEPVKQPVCSGKRVGVVGSGWLVGCSRASGGERWHEAVPTSPDVPFLVMIGLSEAPAIHFFPTGPGRE